MTPRSSREQSFAGRPSRRQLLQAAAGLGLGSVGLSLLASCRDSSTPSGVTSSDAPLETTALRLAKTPNLCFAPQYVAEDLLKAEGFTKVSYRPTTVSTDFDQLLASGGVQIGQNLAVSIITRIEAGDPIVILGGIHIGCTEVFATERIRSMRDLKGKTVAVPWLGTGPQLQLSAMAAYVGIDPRRDITWEVHPSDESIGLLAAGKTDAYPALPPDPQRLRAGGIGHVIVNTGLDRPWSQYYCCVLVANRDFVHRNPVATKHAVRAILKATDLCASTPDGAAQLLVDRGYAAQYDYASQAMHEIGYRRWWEYDSEDTVRFHALRLKEIGVIKSSPDKIVERGTDWRIFNELKKELKA